MQLPLGRVGECELSFPGFYLATRITCCIWFSDLTGCLPSPFHGREPRAQRGVGGLNSGLTSSEDHEPLFVEFIGWCYERYKDDSFLGQRQPWPSREACWNGVQGTCWAGPTHMPTIGAKSMKESLGVVGAHWEGEEEERGPSGRLGRT